jgi:hypothetical protein
MKYLAKAMMIALALLLSSQAKAQSDAEYWINQLWDSMRKGDTEANIRPELRALMQHMIEAYDYVCPYYPVITALVIHHAGATPR